MCLGLRISVLASKTVPLEELQNPVKSPYLWSTHHRIVVQSQAKVISESLWFWQKKNYLNINKATSKKCFCRKFSSLAYYITFQMNILVLILVSVFILKHLELSVYDTWQMIESPFNLTQNEAILHMFPSRYVKRKINMKVNN